MPLTTGDARSPASVEGQAAHKAASSSAAPATPQAHDRDALPAALDCIVRHSGGAEAQSRLPLLVAIHGRSDTPERFARRLVALERPARLVLPRAPRPYKHGGTWFPGLPGDEDLTPMAAGADAVTRLIAELIAERAQSPLTCGAPVVTGVSQGGLLTLALATHHPHLVGEAIAVVGFLPESMVPESADKRAGQITMLNGKEDRLVPIALARQTAARLTRVGFQVTMVEQPVAGHTIGPLMQQRWHDLLDRALRRACR